MKSISVDVAVLTVRDGVLSILLVRLPASHWAVPSAPVGRATTLEEAALAALADRAGIDGVGLEQLYTFDRDGGGGAGVAYLALIDAGRHPPAPGPGVVEVRWFPIHDLPALDAAGAEVVAYAHRRLRDKAAYAPIAFQLMPEAFTLGELQVVYEAVLGHALDTRNFRRDVLAAGVIEPVGRLRGEGPGRPARLYRFGGGEFQVLARERRIARAIRHRGGGGAGW